MRRFALVPVAVIFLSACPPINSTPCNDDSQCRADQRCRRGACGPICLADTDCGTDQVCLGNGTCGARPECTSTNDCAAGFVCSQGRCQCEDDSACAANQQCMSGQCQTRPRCTADADCLGTGGRCEVTQGLCLPVCVMPTDCAPTLDPRVAFAIYTCVQGTCTRRCTQDLQCGGQGLICVNGLCQKAPCAQLSDCPAGQYCTSSVFGRCEPYQVCQQNTECPRNYECRAFTQTQCPPGFDCSKKICQELQRCLADGDCVSGVPGTMGAMVTGYCEEGHCQPSAACQVSQQCTSTQSCIGNVCVPSVCRGHLECPNGQACVDGKCSAAPAADQIELMKISPTTGLLIEGQSMQLRVIAFRADGTSFPLPSANFEIRDDLGMASTNATATTQGVLTAVTAGTVKVRATVTGAFVNSNEATIQILPRVMMGRRVVVTDAASGNPLGGVVVRACPAADCSMPTDVTTGADGLADFPLLDSSAITVTAAPTTLRADGLPAFERASILGTTVTDIALPLRANPVKSAAGWSGSISFSYVSTTGSYWAGFITASASDVPSLTANGLLGDNFMTEVPGINQQVPVPGAFVLYTSPGLGFPQEVKARSLAFAQPGPNRFAQAWAGRAQLDSVLNLRSIDVLSYLGAFDYEQQRALSFTARQNVPDATDVDGDGLCSDTQKCPMGSEDVPDYANFTRLSFQPSRQQKLRTEVVVPGVPSTFDTVLVSSALFDQNAGMLPTGFASKAAGQPGADGLRQIDPIVVRGGAAYNGLEIAQPGLWVLAANARGDTFSGRLLRTPVLGTRVLVTPFLPAPADTSYAPGSRTFNPGQPAWNSVYSTGGEFARASLTGSDTRHTIYFAMSNGQASVPWPTVPTAPGQDPAAQPNSTLELVAVDLVTGVSIDSVVATGGVTLATWSEVIDGYARFDR
ncbi:MAG: carboxypeptidase-like regulatory domain-containing protein [Myxococcaceae bacterium]